jgi:DNA-binding transcriptional LysR family regulator
MNWRRLDLNLLVVFDAVMHERSATRAAEKLSMSQPAVSQALGRLRSALGDELFVRTPEGMEPTPQAKRLAPSVRQALVDLRAALESARPFEPQQVERSFVVTVNNYAALVIAPSLAAAVAREAPAVTLDLRPSGTLDIIEWLDRGEVDLALGSLAAPGERFSDMRLLDDRFACVMRKEHPAVNSKGAIVARDFADLSHLEVSSTSEGTRFVDDALAKLGLERRIALRAPLLATAGILARSDMVAVLAERLARVFAAEVPLQVLPLPVASPSLTVAMLWHRRVEDDAAHRWLRGVVRRATRSL